jgi:hypothetical protein
MFYYSNLILIFTLPFFLILEFIIQTFLPFDDFFGGFLSGEIGLTISSLPLFKPSGSSNNTGFIPWKITSSSINAQNALIKFYSWLPAESPVKLFIDTHCLLLQARWMIHF